MISLHDVELEVVLIADESVSEAPPSAIMIWECILNLCNLVKLSVTYISVPKRFPNHSQFQKNQDDWGGFGPPGPPPGYAPASYLDQCPLLRASLLPTVANFVRKVTAQQTSAGN